jgi:pimeloyl-ACP methyl ester carboxylesterase
MDIELTTIKSTFDGEEQYIKYYRASRESRPLLVALHSWGSDYTQEFFCEYYKRCKDRNWHLIHPDFRGPNKRPEACGSKAAMNDIIDAVKWSQNEFHIDHRRIFLIGVSGGHEILYDSAFRWLDSF